MMKIKVVREVLCESVKKNQNTGTWDCAGIYDCVSVMDFPAVVDFSFVVWLKGITSDNNNLMIMIKNSHDMILVKDEDSKAYLFEQMHEGVFVLNLNQVHFKSSEEFYKIEVFHSGKNLLTKKVSATNMYHMEPIPITSFGDQGILKLL